MSAIQGAYDSLSENLMALRDYDPYGYHDHAPEWEAVIKDVSRLKTHLVAVISEGREALVEAAADKDARLWTHAALQGLNVEVTALRKRTAEKEQALSGSAASFERGRAQGQEECLEAIEVLLTKGAVDANVGKALMGALQELLAEAKS